LIEDLDLENFGKKKKKKAVFIPDDQEAVSGDEEKVCLINVHLEIIDLIVI